MPARSRVAAAAVTTCGSTTVFTISDRSDRRSKSSGAVAAEVHASEQPGADSGIRPADGHNPWWSSITQPDLPAREGPLVIRAVRSAVRSIAGFQLPAGASDTSEDRDGYGIYGTMGHRDPAGHQVEGLVRGFPGGGSSPLRRMSEGPAHAGLLRCPYCAVSAREGTAPLRLHATPCVGWPHIMRAVASERNPLCSRGRVN